jgi:predicted cupin superfamily sugar epimerase
MTDLKQEAVLELEPHPEGGRYRRLFESTDRVVTHRGAVRSSLTHIHYALEPGESSRFHRVDSDEVWHLYRGAGVRLHLWHPDDAAPACVELDAARQRYCHVVPAGTWQAAEPLTGSVLLGCTVAPGFDWEDFELIDAQPALAARLREIAPSLARFIDPPVEP